jgi:hypothetical protein
VIKTKPPVGENDLPTGVKLNKVQSMLNKALNPRILI